MAPEILSGKNCHDIAAIWVAFFSNTSMSAISLRTGERYNEKVDVYSFALVLLELVACEMPWFSVKTSAPAPGLFPPCSALLTTTRLRRDGVPISPTEVPHRVISHERPESQLGARLPLCPAKGRVACLSSGDALCRGGGRGSGAAGQGVLAQTPQAPPNVSRGEGTLHAQTRAPGPAEACVRTRLLKGLNLVFYPF